MGLDTQEVKGLEKGARGSSELKIARVASPHWSLQTSSLRPRLQNGIIPDFKSKGNLFIYLFIFREVKKTLNCIL